MRPRFLVHFGQADTGMRDNLARRLADVLPTHHQTGDLSLFCHPQTPLVGLPMSQGHVIGTLISRSSGQRLVSLPPAQDRAIESSWGRHLLETMFGAYVAIWQDGRGRLCVLRDPSGAQPLLHARTGRDLWVFSDVDLAARAGIPIAICWDGMVHSLLYPQLSAECTPIAGVSEILPGQLLRFDDGARSELAWQPWSFARPAGDPEGHQARASLAPAIDGAVSAWAACFDKVQLELSGGLDSSIIAAALAASGANWSCVTAATPSGDGDERHYARQVAERLGFPLTELAADADDVDPFQVMERLTPRPRGMNILAGIDRKMGRAADEAGADAIFSGVGGDNVFAYTGSTAPVLDALARHGVAFSWAVANDVAGATGTTIFDVLRHVVRRVLMDACGWSPAPRPALLARGVARRAELHPWLAVPDHVARGTRAHIGAIVRIHPILDCVGRNATRTMVFPLLSQPVMETCLAIPSWCWVEGGRDRAAVRQAFRGRLPDAVLLRRTKGRLESLIVPAIERARPRIRTLLLDGLLCGAGLIDRSAVEEGLRRPITDRAPHHDRLLKLVDAELWSRQVLALASMSPCG